MRLRIGGNAEELYKIVLNDPDSHNGVTKQEPGILECEVKWALGRITMGKASGGDRFPAELFKAGAVKNVSKFGKLSSGQRTGKDQFSFQSQRRAMSKIAQTTVHLCSFHMLASFWSEFFKLGFSSMGSEDFQRYKLDLEKEDEPDLKLPTFVRSQRNEDNSKKKPHLLLLH